MGLRPLSPISPQPFQTFSPESVRNFTQLSHHLRALQVDGSVEESMVDESVSRMYTLMHRLGIFDAKPAYGGIGSWPREQSRKRMYSSDHVVQSRPKNGPIGWALRH